ncbi:class I SAM-dependent methyltransferase [Kutzneria sp. CA-103260]|uniref:class I SAM-dependent methyltransferase n=1 Tax=Kutzneria sp. CA-103260 TaxID=2802641 RepID=UPI001BA8F9DA|nr:class I SAM-dependent methyltransferase [Kutzneria sp. CA-103260]QUQ63631.1 27-O-demethylrifamycin SV methyltransferase [Kutzneria sp. CA-103260]
MDQRYWDELYGSRDQLFSGNPNGVLVTEVAGMTPGQALDVGCGEGADAHWLASRGWMVTAVDISRTALDRAAKLNAGDRVSWTHADLAVTPPPARAFDLVSVQYFPLTKENSSVHGLLAAVAPGGTLLVVGHDPADLPAEFDRDDYHWPSEIAATLGDEWKVLVDETRLRTTPPPPGSHHVRDTVLRAEKRH